LRLVRGVGIGWKMNLRRIGEMDLLVSMLTDAEEIELGLTGEAAACRSAGIEFRRYPVPDRHTPESAEGFRAFVESLYAQVMKGRSVAAHCRAGIGRSSILVASLLCRQGYSADEAFRRISVARGMRVPDTEEQVRWVERFSASP
jgi:protein-tyrosine phosphatase